MFRKPKKTIFDYVEHHDAYNDVEDLLTPKYLENTVSIEHRELQGYIEEYWDLLHELVRDYINSYALVYKKIGKELEDNRDHLENSRRQLTFEQQNVQDLADEMREIKGALQSEVVVRRDLESRLNDERSMMEAQFKEEKRALELIADSNLKDASMDEVMKKLQSSIGSSEKVLALKAKVEKLEKQIQKEREENEAIQEEVSTSFMAKIVKSDEMIRNLKERLGDD
jgi:hypothetical protein